MSNEVTTINKEGEVRPSGLMQASHNFVNDRKGIESRLSQLKTMQAGISIAPMYFEFSEKGQKIRGIFLGYLKLEKVDEKTGEVKEIDSVAWMDETQTIYQNAGTQLVGAFTSNNVPQGTPVEIEFLGQKKVKEGYMKQYAIRPLVPAETPAAE